WLKMLAIAVILDVLVFCSALMHFLNPLVASVMICAITLIWLAAVSFFRDPKRKIPTDPALVLSPADGTVRDIELIKSESVECEELRDLFSGAGHAPGRDFPFCFQCAYQPRSAGDEDQVQTLQERRVS
ncbi:MAG: phosphatidylserine decarboxylase, partial [Lentisphaeria bacterium]|nr:phosphatidylserine decarboxylase [Lentisphaeria bacterium]